uniref:tRNA pseudouridine(55) synthase n=1 Tax=Fagus sylvatica TaxID=28930 RepID=A0A2N9I8C4_FAGSY
MIINRPTQPHPHRLPSRVNNNSDNSPEPDSPEKPTSELGIEGWVDRKLLSETETDRPSSGNSEMNKSMRKYYNKRRKRMYGSDSDEGDSRNEDGFVELKPNVVEFNTLHKREEELYFYDTFAYPWEKDKHYKMVYQLEKKYFPDQCLDKAFLQPGESNESSNVKKGKKKGGDDGKGLVFFDEGGGGEKGRGELAKKDTNKDVVGKKVEEFFKCLKKVPNKDGEVGDGEPYLLTRSTELPPRWDGPYGTVVLVNKPKGWTSFTVCGKLRRLVKVKKVGHAGTLDPMATGLLIVCVGKATKMVDGYQGMVKGYSGVFRLGEATSTWDADSPVIQREPWEHIKDEDLKKTAASFCGEIWQVPPMFSAIKNRIKSLTPLCFSSRAQPITVIGSQSTYFGSRTVNWAGLSWTEDSAGSAETQNGPELSL